MVFYYMARDNLCFLTLCEDAYPKRLAFLYLEDIADIILNELQREYGTNVSYLQCDAYIYVGYRRYPSRHRVCYFAEMRIPILSMNSFVMIQ